MGHARSEARFSSQQRQESCTNMPDDYLFFKCIVIEYNKVFCSSGTVAVVEDVEDEQEMTFLNGHALCN